jgi:hypothetical protein
MDSLSQESSLHALCLQSLRDETIKTQYPDGLRKTPVAVLGNCDAVTQQMLGLLETLSGDSLGRPAQRTATGRDELGRPRSNWDPSMKR